MKRSIVVGNWKMHATSVGDAHILATTIRNNVAKLNLEVVLCPPYVWLCEVKNILGRSTKLHVGAQNVFFEPEGAYTGEISPLMLKGLAKFVIVGHSERREHFEESGFEINEKVIAALKAGLSPIICVGERKKKGNPSEPIRELTEALANVPKKYYPQIVIAYEPVWAIGTKDNADPEYVARMAVRLRETVHADTPILYGGSVSSKNVIEYAKRPELDGVLVGGASVRASEFVKICREWAEARIFHKYG